MADLLIGIGITTSAAADADPVGDAVTAERLGYDFVSASDHPVGSHPTFELLSLLTWVAARTSAIGIATRVLGVPFRRPAMVAKTAESLQRLSGGRLVLGLGGGHDDNEIRAVGGDGLSPRQKVDGLADAITIMRSAWAGTGITHHGTEYAVTGLTLTPAPTVPIPIWLGTYGPRALAVTGRLADGWIPSLGFAPPDRIPEMLARIRDAAVNAGRDADAVRAVYNVPVRLGQPARTDADTISGTAREVVDQLRDLLALGFRGLNLVLDQDDIRPVADDVLPALRANAP